MADPTTQLRAFSAPQAKLFYGGQEIGWANNVNVSETITQVPVTKLGDVHVQAYETTAVTVAGSFDYIHIKNKPLSTQVGVASNGDAATLWPNPAAAGATSSSEDRSDYYVEFPEMDM